MEPTKTQLFWASLVAGAVLFGIAATGYGAGYGVAVRDYDEAVEVAREAGFAAGEKATSVQMEQGFQQRINALTTDHAKELGAARDAARDDLAELSERLRKQGYAQAVTELEPLALQKIASARSEGFKSGKADAIQSFLVIEKQQRELVKQIFPIVTSQAVRSSLQDDTNRAISKAKSDFDNGNLKEAIASLPKGIEIIPKTSCTLTGQAIRSEKNSFYIDCDTSKRVFISRIDDRGITYSIGGGPNYSLIIGKSINIRDTECKFSLLNTVDKNFAETIVNCN